MHIYFLIRQIVLIQNDFPRFQKDRACHKAEDQLFLNFEYDFNKIIGFFLSYVTRGIKLSTFEREREKNSLHCCWVVYTISAQIYMLYRQND